MSYTPPAAPQPYLPNVSWKTPAPSSPVASRNDINSVATPAADIQAQVAAENAPLRVIYGRCRIGAQVADALSYQNDLIMVLVWGEGEVQEIESITVNDEAPPAGITLTHYHGTAGQTVNALLVSAYASHGITYADALPGIAYSVARVPAGITSGFPVFNAIIKGLKLAGMYPFNFADRFSFSRASTDTYFGSNGLLQTAASNAPVFEYDPITGESLGLRIQESRINKFTYSEQFDNAAWTKTASTITADATTAPNGEVTADSFIASATAALHMIAITFTPTTTTTYTQSIYAKAGGYRYLIAQFNAGGVNVYQSFDLQSGVLGVTNGGTPAATITHVGGGWYRCTVKATTVSISSGPVLYWVQPTDSLTGTVGDGGGIYIWGAQLEVGAFPTSYIPTTTAAVTRQPDAASLAIATWLGSDTGTWLVEFMGGLESTQVGYGRVLSNSGSTAIIARNGSATITSYDGVTVSKTGGGDPATTFVRAAVAYGSATKSVTYTGLTPATGAYTAGIYNASPVYFGRNAVSATNMLNGHIKSVCYWPEKKSDAWIATMTAAGSTYRDSDDAPALILDFANGTYYADETVFSDNPARALADFIPSTLYGMGRTVEWASDLDSANFCDELCGSEKRRLISLVLDQPNECKQWLEALRTYAGCFVSHEGADMRLIHDKAGSVDMSFTASTIKANSLKLKKRGIQQIPTVMEIRYTDTSLIPWAEKSAIVKAAGVDAGTTPRRESQVSLPGITRYSQALREATERMNKLTLSDLSCDFVTFDEALKLQVGAIIAVTHPIGLTAKQMRVMACDIAEAGRWRISALEYDPAAYSDVVTAEPTYTDTTLPNPAAPPAITGITAIEEVYQLENGTYASRIKTTWDAVTFPYLASYRIEIYQAGVLIDTANPTPEIYRTAAVQEGLEYVVKVASITTIGTVGAWAQANIIAAGKYLIPGNVPSVGAFEAGGRVYVSWTPAIDIDIWRYEVRYGAIGVAWASTLLIDRVDALRLTSDQIPTGTWTLHVKALDSVQQYSTTAATADVTVTSDNSSFLISNYDQTNPALTNMASYTINPTDSNSYAVTEDGVLAATKFPSTASSYGDIAATYHNSVTSTWLGESEDFGLLLGGNWTGTATVEDISGTHISYMGFSPDSSTWTYLSGLSQKTNARFARLKHEGLTTDTIKVTMPTQNIRLDAIPREEVGTGTSSASGTVTITLSNLYVAVKKLTITPEGTTARSATYDNIVIGMSSTTFDVYIFDDAGVKIASPFRYEWQGV